jgi:hypothetical protein
MATMLPRMSSQTRSGCLTNLDQLVGRRTERRYARTAGVNGIVMS